MKKYLITYTIPTGKQYETTIYANRMTDAQNKFYNRYVYCHIITTESHPVKDSFLKKMWLLLYN